MTFMKISFDLIKKKKILIPILILFLIIIIAVFSLLKKNDAETSLPYEENISQDNDLLATKEKIEEIDEKKESKEIIKKKLNDKKTIVKKKKEETAVPKQKIVKKNFEEKIIKKRKPIDTIIELHHGLKKINTNIESSLNDTKKLINLTYDTEKMLSLIIGDIWKNQNNAIKSEMISVFEEYITKNYVKRFSKIKNPDFENLEEKKIGSHLMVKSNLILNGKEKVSINYLLTLKGKQWRIFDVLLAGSVSEVATKKSEFSSFIKEGSISPLIEALKEKNKELLL